MKLETTIPPRKDGTVIARFGEDVYTFTADNGSLSCEVGKQEHVAFLLGTGNFYPAREADYAAATELLKQDEEPEDEDEPEVSGPPVEANTPPRRGRPKKV